MPKRGRSDSTTAVVKRIKSHWGVKKPALRPVKLSTKGPELKVVDTSDATVLDVAANVTPLLLNGIATGTDLFNRVGRKVTLKSIMFKGTAYLSRSGTNATAVGDRYTCRVALVYDEQANGATPANTDIFQGIDNTGSAITSAFSGVNLNNRDRFKIIKDWVMTFKPQTASATGTDPASSGSGQHGMVNINWYAKLDMPMIFSGTGSTSASIQTGALYLVRYQNQANAANGQNISVQGVSRVRFEDA